MAVAPWFEGIFLLGQFNRLQAGCWLFVHKNEAAILEMPPCSSYESSPADVAFQACQDLGVEVRYLLCTHAHLDHFSLKTLHNLHITFRSAQIHLQSGFADYVRCNIKINYFKTLMLLRLGGEPLFLVHAPKHSDTDTLVIFRGSICTGDWELGTIRSVHDSSVWGSVPRSDRLNSIERMIEFQKLYNYTIHNVFSVHANDRRENVDFAALMASTKLDKKLW